MVTVVTGTPVGSEVERPSRDESVFRGAYSEQSLGGDGPPIKKWRAIARLRFACKARRIPGDLMKNQCPRYLAAPFTTVPSAR